MKKIFLIIGFSFFVNQLSICQSQDHIIPSSSELFKFHNGFWTNLHHLLYVQARAQMNTPDSDRRAVVGAKKDLEKIQDLSQSEQEIWESALSYYRENLASASILFDRNLSKISGILTLEESNPTIQSKALDSELIDILTKAASVYRNSWWPQHKQGNKDWVAGMNPLLETYGEKLSKRLMAIYSNEWPEGGLRVDVSAYANWAGAYSTWPPQRIVFSSRDADLKDGQGLETLFHEAMHFLERPVSRELYQKTIAVEKQIPNQFTHGMIFYTAGEVVKELIPEHHPYAEKHGIWNRGPWPNNLLLIKKHWRPYMDGEVSLDDTLNAIVQDFD